MHCVTTPATPDRRTCRLPQGTFRAGWRVSSRQAQVGRPGLLRQVACRATIAGGGVLGAGGGAYGPRPAPAEAHRAYW